MALSPVNNPSPPPRSWGPSVSVVMPAYQAADTVAQAITSVQSQTFRDWELLVVDDGSTDHTIRIAQALADRDSRIRVIEGGRAGIVATLNRGIAAAQGRYVARMDADDEMFPERLAAQVEALESDPELGVVGCLVAFGGDLAQSGGYALHVDWVNSLASPEQIALNRFVESPFAHPSVMFRRQLVEQHGGYIPGPFPEDYELWLRWMDAGVKMGKVPRVLLRWNDPPCRLSRTDSRYEPEAFFRVKARWLARELRRRGLAAIGSSLGPSPANDPRDRRRIWIWGAGRPTRKRVAHLVTEGVEIAGYVDVDPKKTNRFIAGLPVIAPDDLPPPDEAFVLPYVSSRGARDLIRAALHARGYRDGHDFLPCG